MSLVPYAGGGPLYKMGYTMGRRYAPRVAGWAAHKAARVIGRAARAWYRGRKRKRTTAWREVKRLRRDIERPLHRDTAGATTAQNTGTLSTIQIGAGIIAGNQIDDRHGRYICIRGVNVKLALENTQTAQDMNFRILMLQARSGVAVADAADISTGLFKAGSSSTPVSFSTGGNNEQATVDIINPQKWKILWQKKIKVLRDHQASMGRQTYHRNHLIKFGRRGKKMYFAGAGSLSWEQIKPAIWLVYFNERPEAGAGTTTSLSVSIAQTTYFCRN